MRLSGILEKDSLLYNFHIEDELKLGDFWDDFSGMTNDVAYKRIEDIFEQHSINNYESRTILEFSKLYSMLYPKGTFLSRFLTESSYGCAFHKKDIETLAESVLDITEVFPWIGVQTYNEHGIIDKTDWVGITSKLTNPPESVWVIPPRRER